MLANWLSSPRRFDQTEIRAELAYRRICDKPSEIVFRKPDGTNTDSQLVRLEYDSVSYSISDVSGEVASRGLIIFGIRGHPVEEDTDIKENYRFNKFGDGYVVSDVIYTIGEIQAICKAIG